jgi:lysophospholipase L1-like esterase
VVWAVSFLAFLFVVSRPPCHAKTGLLTRKVFVFFCIMTFVFEVPFHLSPKIPQKSSGKLYVIGDSVSAGIGGRSERPWPEVLKDRYKVDVVNLSMAGATVGSIIPKTDRISDDNAIVLLEIGGNDLFSPTPPMIFEQHLRSLLQKVVKSNRVVIMLELPLAPWYIRYGRIQRKLADEFGVILIPKSFFADVLSTKGATLDLAHLSPEGHKIMAEKIWSLLGKHLKVKSGNQ